jgi:hypothetical protein
MRRACFKGRSPFSAAYFNAVCDICRICLAGIVAIDREQWHAEITHFSEQAIQGGLINHRAAQQGHAIVFQRDGQSFKPVRPLMTQMAFDPDLIDHGLTWINYWVAFIHILLFPLHHSAQHGGSSHKPPCGSVYAVAAARMRLSDFTVFTPTTSRYRTIQISAMVGTMTMNGWICLWKSGTRNAVIRCTK